MDERTRRIGQNEALFRRVNNAVEEVATARSTVAEDLTIVCECGDETCVEEITLPLAEYEALRAQPTRFATRPGHEEAQTERIVEQHAGYWVVEKRAGGPARLARALDDRESGT